MTPTNPTQSKLNMLRAKLTQLRDSDLFSPEEKTKLIAEVNEQLEKLNNYQQAPTQ